MASIHRIMVIDTRAHLSDLVRAAMSMLGRRYAIYEVPSPESALDEIARVDFDLVVTALALDGGMNGLELAKRAIRERAGLAIVVVAAENDAAIELEQLQEVPVQFMPYPPGEKFVRALRVGLDGADVVEAAEGPVEVDLGPIPTLDVDKARGILVNTMRDAGAIGGLIADRTGRVVVDERTGYIDKSLIAAVLGPTFAHATKIGPQIGGQGWSLKFYDGNRYDLFALALGYHYFAAFLFDDTKTGAFGAMTRFGRQGAEEIIKLLGDSAWTFEQPATLPTPALSSPRPSSRPPKHATQPLPKIEAAPTPPPVLDEPILEPVVGELDFDLLFGQAAPDDSSFDDLFENNQPSDLNIGNIHGDKMSFEEAQNMGLLGD
ncbi:MAG: response regulator [Chloroflexi bacterium]|nr:response regulator [Chloroflexota bacterium]